MNEKMIEMLIAKGFARWTKGDKDRLYLNCKAVNDVVEFDYYKSGNIKECRVNGEAVSNSEGYRIKAAKTYIDIATGETVSNNDIMEDIAKALYAEAENEIKEETEMNETETRACTEEEAVESYNAMMEELKPYIEMLDRVKAEIAECETIWLYITGIHDSRVPKGFILDEIEKINARRREIAEIHEKADTIIRGIKAQKYADTGMGGLFDDVFNPSLYVITDEQRAALRDFGVWYEDRYLVNI